MAETREKSEVERAQEDVLTAALGYAIANETYAKAYRAAGLGYRLVDCPLPPLVEAAVKISNAAQNLLTTAAKALYAAMQAETARGTAEPGPKKEPCTCHYTKPEFCGHHGPLLKHAAESK
jgi:hypothetical protein